MVKDPQYYRYVMSMRVIAVGSHSRFMQPSLNSKFQIAVGLDLNTGVSGVWGREAGRLL